MSLGRPKNGWETLNDVQEDCMEAIRTV